jgi:hypothetical protein
MPIMKKFLVAASFFVVSATSNAYQVQLNGNVATGVLDLDIGNAFYDVLFVYVPGPHSVPDPADIFAAPASDETGAQRAVSVINDALNSSSAIAVGSAAGGGSSLSYLVPFLFNDPTCDTLCAKRGSSGYSVRSWAGPTQADISNGTGVYFARFSPAIAEAPLPPAFFLFSSGLAVLLWVRYRRPHFAPGGLNSNSMPLNLISDKVGLGWLSRSA